MGAAAGYAVGGPVMGGAGFLSGIDTSPKTSVHVFGWVPVSMSDSQAAAQQVVETTFLTALAAEVGGGFAEVQVHGDILAIRKPGCGESDRSCRYTMGTRTLDLAAGKPVAPTFVPVSEQVWGPVGRRIVTTALNDVIALASQRDLALRVSARLPAWMFLYLPASRQGPSVVLQAGKVLYFGTK